MTDAFKIKPTHTQRAACVYIRQSTPGQVEHNRESTARQYALADRAAQLGWPKEQVVVIDELEDAPALFGCAFEHELGYAVLDPRRDLEVELFDHRLQHLQLDAFHAEGESN